MNAEADQLLACARGEADPVWRKLCAVELLQLHAAGLDWGYLERKAAEHGTAAAHCRPPAKMVQ